MARGAEIQVMIDLETMSVRPNAIICSIGAVKFVVGKGITSEFYQTIDTRDCKKLGLHFDHDTLKWWSEQNPHALKMLTKDTVPLEEAITNFTEWFGPTSRKVWGCGSDFDNVILCSAYRAVDITPPWKFWDNRCYRTMKAMFDVPQAARQGTYHNALDDAKHQARHLLTILES